MKKLILIIIFILAPCLVCAGILEVIARKRVESGPTTEISETFTTCANMTNVPDNGSDITCTGGAIYPATQYRTTFAYHNTSISTVEHYAEVECGVMLTQPGDGGGVAVRVNASNYCYAVYVSGGRAWLVRLDSGGVTPLSNNNYGETAGTKTVKLTASGSGATVALEVFVDGVSRLTYDDTSADRITDGTKIGIYIDASNGSNDNFVSTLTGDPL